MDVITYINTITSNSFTDWLRCHNDIFYCNSYDEEIHESPDNDNNAVLISHILKTLFNEKTPSINKYYLMITIEEHLEFFIKTEIGAINIIQLLITGFQKRLNPKLDQLFMCQVLTLISTITIHYNLPLSINAQCLPLTESVINILLEIIMKDYNTQNWACLKHSALCTLLHFESCYPTILCQKKLLIAEFVQKEKSIYFEILLQLYSLVFKNDVLNKCRLQQQSARLVSSEQQNSNSVLYDKQEISKLMFWMSNENSQEKLIGSQAMIYKSIQSMIQDAAFHLTPSGINKVALNCLIVSSCISQHAGSLWDPFIGRFIKTSDINILEILMLLKILSKTGLFKKSLLQDEILQETLFTVMNNPLIAISKRLVAAHWLTIYPFHKQGSINQIELLNTENHSLLEPELTRNIFLRSFDSTEIKYCKLILMSIVMKISKKSDSNSVLLFSSLKELIRSVNYFEPGVFSNILFRVMFAIHSRHYDSIIINDFENVFNNLVIKFPTILPSVMGYLSALDLLNVDENLPTFSSRCLSQIAKLSNEKLTLNSDQLNIEIVKMHIHVLNCAIKISKIDLKIYLDVLLGLISSWKVDFNFQWLEEACVLILELCFNIIKSYGSSDYYRELTSILNEIRFELLNCSMEVKANFLYSLIVSLSCKKVKNLLTAKTFSDLIEEDFNLIYSSLVEDNQNNSNLVLVRNSKSIAYPKAFYEYDGDLSKYFEFINENQFPIVFNCKLQPKIYSDLWHQFLYGVEVEFEMSLHECSVKPWNIKFIPPLTHDSCLTENQLEIVLSKAKSFSIRGRMSVTKLDGIFTFYDIEAIFIDLFELALKAPVVFHSVTDKAMFLENLIDSKLINSSFISIDFNSSTNYNKFQDYMQEFLHSTADDRHAYLMFIPPFSHIILMESYLSEYCRRFDMFTDLNVEDLISFEKFLKSYE